TVMISLINANSPMVWDDTMVGALKAYARHNQAVICTPFILAGAMAPCTVAGTMTQTLAESLAGMALAQLVRPGAPGVLGSFASSLSRPGGACNRGRLQRALVHAGVPQRARCAGLPARARAVRGGSGASGAVAALEGGSPVLPAAG